MAAVLGTLINGSMGDPHMTEGRERTQWDVSAPVVQEVSLLVCDSTSSWFQYLPCV